MTKLQQSVIDQLFTGAYLMVRDRKEGVKGKLFRRFTLYRGNKNPVRIYYESSLAGILKLCKKDKNGAYTLNLTRVRQLRKNTYVKQLYLELKKIKTSHEI
jgi:hypothetical protein